MPNARHIFVQSKQMKKDIVSMGINEKKVTPVPMGVSLEKIPYNRTECLSESNNIKKRILYLGSIEKVRRMDFLIHVFKKVLEQIPDAEFYIVGGSENPNDELILKNEAKIIGIEHAFIFTGFLPMGEAWKYVKKADVCVSFIYPAPQYEAASPTKLIEYMAMGKPVVANHHPEQTLILSASKAGICVSFQTEAFANAIVDLLGNPQKAKKMGMRGRIYVEQNRTYKLLADIVENKFLDICNENNIF